MRTGPAPAHRRRSLARVIGVGGAAAALLAACAASDRPAFSVWMARWNEAQLLVPTERELLEGGRPYCDRLIGRLRTELTDLTPTPAESVDPAYDSWSDRVRTLAFECPTDPTEIDAALSTIHQLEVEIATAEP